MSFILLTRAYARRNNLQASVDMASTLVILSSPTKPHRQAPIAHNISPSPLLFQRALLTTPGLTLPSTSAKRFNSTIPSLPAEPNASKDDASIWDVPDADTEEDDMAVPNSKPPTRKKQPANGDGYSIAKEPTDPIKKSRGRPRKNKDGEDTAAPKEKASRKPRAKKNDANGQTKIGKGRVTKAAAPKLRKTETVSSHFSSASEKSKKEPVKGAENAEEKQLNLEKGQDRRMVSTPVKTAHQENAFTMAEELEHETPEPRKAGVQEFGNLLGNFGYVKGESSTIIQPMVDPNRARKRKLIELVRTGNPTTTSAPSAAPVPKPKPKSVKKKPRTITEKATAEYAIPIDEEPGSAPIMQYFSPIDPVGKPKSRAPKPIKKPAKGKKTISAPILLSPEAAQRQAKKQEFIFGTSSQLATENDNNYLRDLQQAMRLSNQQEEDPFANDLPLMQRKEDRMARKSLWERMNWIEEEGTAEIEELDLRSDDGDEGFVMPDEPEAEAVQAAHEEESWLELATPAPVKVNMQPPPSRISQTVPTSSGDWIELDQTPLPAAVRSRLPPPAPTSEHVPILWSDWVELDKTPRQKAVTKKVDSPSQTLGHPISSGDWVELDDQPVLISKLNPQLPSPIISAPTTAASLSPPRYIQPTYPTPAATSSSTSNSTMPEQSQPRAKKAKAVEKQCPDYTSYSTIYLAKEIASYKFKPVKKREDMITLLQKCWEGRQKQARVVLGQKPVPRPVEGSPSTAQPTETIPSPAKKGRGRPKKVSGQPTTASMRKLNERIDAAARSESAALSSAPATPKKRGRPPRIPKDVVSIPDSISDDEPLTPTPPRLPARELRSPPPLEVEVDFDADATLLPLSPASAAREPFTAITRTITTEPPRCDGKLTWYEKILLYDPILLEDLTKWLNEGGLETVGYDGEVEFKRVKEWCVGRGICCLSKESSRNRNGTASVSGEAVRGRKVLKKIGRQED